MTLRNSIMKKETFKRKTRDRHSTPGYTRIGVLCPFYTTTLWTQNTKATSQHAGLPEWARFPAQSGNQCFPIFFLFFISLFIHCLCMVCSEKDTSVGWLFELFIWYQIYLILWLATCPIWQPCQREQLRAYFSVNPLHGNATVERF